ncbi:MAG TPA: SAM-dependent chlorinase/fluorinase [Acidimicrobiales bacterium]|nr:SAM-dependent chlorinase/fluorinase [Acidimicrobiales bacterium]
MPPRFDTVSFLSDYGTTDEFVGVVKSVIRSIEPRVTVVDITHDIQPYDIKAGSLTLARSVQYLCPGVVLAVVDPGVGTDRRAIAIEVGDGQSYLVGPDNGLLASAVGMVGGATAAVELTNPEYRLASPGPTFDGRDVFGPAAAHLCAGVPLDALGPRVDPADLVPGLVPLPRDEDGAIVGEVLWVDRYGNCQLNIDPEQIASWGERVQLRWTRPPAGAAVGAGQTEGTRTARRVRAFDELGSGQPGLVVDSYGLLAVTMSRASAADTLQIAAGDELALVPLGDEGDRAGDGSAGNGVHARPGSPVRLQPRRSAGS